MKIWKWRETMGSLPYISLYTIIYPYLLLYNCHIFLYISLSLTDLKARQADWHSDVPYEEINKFWNVSVQVYLLYKAL
jgi:hypothetical protein